MVTEMSDKSASKRKDEFKKEEIISLVTMFAELMRAYGSFSGSLGKIQKAHVEAYERLFSLEAIEKLPEMLSKVMEEKPPELSKLIIRIFSKMTAFLPRINKIMALSAEDKIKLGENLRSLAKDFGKLLEWIEKEEE